MAPPLPVWRRRLGPALAILLVLIGLAEVWPANQPLVDVPTAGQGTDWVDWLAQDRAPVSGDGSVAMYPFPANGNYGSYEATTVWMLAALDHHRPLVNGYSGLFPDRYDKLEEAMRNGFPADDSVSRLQEAGVSWVVVPRAWAETDGAESLAAWKAIVDPVFVGTDMIIYSLGSGSLPPPEPTPEPAPEEGVPPMEAPPVDSVPPT